MGLTQLEIEKHLVEFLILQNQLASILKIAGLTQGSVLFAGADGKVNEDNSNLFWDDINNRLGVGTASPARTLDVTGDIEVAIFGGRSGSVLSLNYNFVTPHQAMRFQGTAGVFQIATISNKDIALMPDGTGNVGIGTTTPSTKLHVQDGDITITGGQKLILDG